MHNKARTMEEGLAVTTAELGAKKPWAKHDHLSQELILTDSGVMSVFPPNIPQVADMAKRSCARAVKSSGRLGTLHAANGTLIKTLGIKIIPLCL